MPSRVFGGCIRGGNGPITDDTHALPRDPRRPCATAILPRNFLTIALLYAVAAAAGYLFSLLHVPLPWMIGPLIVAAAVGLLDLNPGVPWITRPIGQMIVAASVGLFFTPEAVSALGQQVVAMVAAAFLTIGAGFLAAMVLMRLARVDVVTASLACIPGSPVEMTGLAVRHGAQSGAVAFAQVLRIALLVLIIPPVLALTHGGVGDAAAALNGGAATDWRGAGLLLFVALAGGFAMRAVRMTSPFFLGPLAAAAAAAAATLPVSALPYPVLAGAQILLGVWLGCTFDRELLRRVGSLMPAILFSTLVLLALCALMALAISALTGIGWPTMVLATAPGSVTEMALTAKILQQGVALVTAFHITRIFIILPAAPLIFGLMARAAGRSRPVVPAPRDDAP